MIPEDKLTDRMVGRRRALLTADGSEPAAPPAAEPLTNRVTTSGIVDDELTALRHRIDAARVVQPGLDKHCLACFHRGRDAALGVIDGPARNGRVRP